MTGRVPLPHKKNSPLSSTEELNKGPSVTRAVPPHPVASKQFYKNPQYLTVSEPFVEPFLRLNRIFNFSLVSTTERMKLAIISFVVFAPVAAVFSLQLYTTATPRCRISTGICHVGAEPGERQRSERQFISILTVSVRTRFITNPLTYPRSCIINYDGDH